MLTSANSLKSAEESKNINRDSSHEPMHRIFQKHDTDQDGFLKRGEVTNALAEAGIRVVDEDLAFEWLDRNFENKLTYREFRRASEKSTVLCQSCQYARAESSDEDDQEELLRTYWRKFDPERNGWCYADVVIDYLAKDWGVQVESEQRKLEQKLMNADNDGKIVYKKFKLYFTAVPEDDLKHRVSSRGTQSMNSMQNFEKHLDEMLLRSQIDSHE